MKRSLLAIASAAGLVCLGSTPAWASPSPTPDVNWTYNFTPNTPGNLVLPADNPNSGSVSFTNEPTKSATNSSDVVVTNLKVSSTASPDSPATLNSAGAWSIGLKLTDGATGTSGLMTFTGKLGGTFSQYSANVTNAFNGQTTQTWTASNGDQFKVTLVGYTPPGPPTASNAGSIAAYVQVTPGGTTPGGGTPEPSTLVLSFLGLSFAGLSSWRKRRRSLAAMLA
jgi:hypothetical protein